MLVLALLALAALAVMLGGSPGPAAKVEAPTSASSVSLLSPKPPLPTSGPPISQAQWDAAVRHAPPSNVNWSYLPSVGLNEFGLPVDATMINHLNNLHIKLVRYYLSWLWVQPDLSSNTYNWARVDQDLANLKANGIYSQILISGCPSPACVPTYDGGENGPVTAAYYNQFVAFYSAAMQRYANADYMAYAWEMFNEPDKAWIGTAGDGHTYVEHYAGDLASFYLALHAACSSCIALNGGLAQALTGADDDWLVGQPGDRTGGALWWGMGAYSDALNFHFYHGAQYGLNPGVAGGPTILDDAARQRAHLGYFRQDSLPLVVNEEGSDSAHNSWSQEKQARYLLYNQAQAMSVGIKSLNIFEYQDNTSYGNPAFRHSGLVTDAFQYKAAHTIVARYTLEIGSQPYIGQPTGLPGGVNAYIFQSNRVPGATTWLLWKSDDPPASINIPDPDSKIRSMADMYGNPMGVIRGCNNSCIVVQAQLNPIYLRWNP